MWEELGRGQATGTEHAQFGRNTVQKVALVPRQGGRGLASPAQWIVLVRDVTLSVSGGGGLDWYYGCVFRLKGVTCGDMWYAE